MTDRRFVASHAQGEKDNMRLWEVPSDFSHSEMKLFAEICSNGVLSASEAETCVRHLRK